MSPHWRNIKRHACGFMRWILRWAVRWNDLNDINPREATFTAKCVCRIYPYVLTWHSSVNAHRWPSRDNDSVSNWHQIWEFHIPLLSSSALSMLNTTSLLCDCQLQWLGQWLIDSHFHQSVSAVCAHPASLVGRDILSVTAEEFVCGQCTLSLLSL